MLMSRSGVGKGSVRRKQQISNSQFDKNWSMIKQNANDSVDDPQQTTNLSPSEISFNDVYSKKLDPQIIVSPLFEAKDPYSVLLIVYEVADGEYGVIKKDDFLKIYERVINKNEEHTT